LKAGQPNLRSHLTSSPQDVRRGYHRFTIAGRPVVSIFRVRREHSFPAVGARLPADSIDRPHTMGAHRQSRDAQEGQAAEAAIGGKPFGEETLAGTPNRILGVIRRNLPANNRTPGYCSGGLTSPDSVLTTAEDSLLETPRRKLDPAANLLTPAV
jgi:hypothetical protein